MGILVNKIFMSGTCLLDKANEDHNVVTGKSMYCQFYCIADHFCYFVFNIAKLRKMDSMSIISTK